MTYVTGLLSIGMEPTARAPQDGIRGTWQWTWVSMLALIGLGYAPPVWSLAATGVWHAREFALLAVGTASLVASLTFAGALRAGLGQNTTTTTARVILMVTAIVTWVIASVAPILSIEWVLIPWTAASVIAVDLPAHRRWWWLGGTALALALTRVITAAITGTGFAQMWAVSGTRSAILLPALVVILPLATVFQMWLWQVVISLDAARSERAELARAQERLRFASDLHHVQGHHLQVIALKTELAERLLARDPGKAAALIGETQDLAREALEDTRRLVKGYRAVPFAVEAENAAAVLDAAGIRVDMDLSADPPGALDHLLGSLLREASTNIIRHSAASHALIALCEGSDGDTVLHISNDGIPEHPRGADGTGIISLTEQYQAAGGSLTVTAAQGRFVLSGTLPSRAGAT